VEVARLDRPAIPAPRPMPSIVNVTPQRDAAPPEATNEPSGNGAPQQSFDAVTEVAVAAPPPAPAPAPVAAAPASASVMKTEAARPAAAANNGLGLMAEAKAADMQLALRPDSVFGISVDHRAFERIKSAIEHGEQPETASIDVAALVNYFAGSAKHETLDVRLDAEGSTAPVVSDAARRMV